jgi:enamine deaminase RidA (YjgF/YER057c/UK114 family)
MASTPLPLAPARLGCGSGRLNLGDKPMRRFSFLLAMVLAGVAAPALAQDIRREVSPGAPIANSVELPPRSRIVYVSGTVPAVANSAAPQGSVERYGDTAAQTRSVLRTIEARLRAHGMGLGDVVMMRVFLVAPPGRQQMDFAGMMTAYREFFGTAAQPNVPARSTMAVAGLVDPGWLVEIEVTAARRGRRR